MWFGKTRIRLLSNISPTMASRHRSKDTIRMRSLLWSQELPVEYGMTIVCYHLMAYYA